MCPTAKSINVEAADLDGLPEAVLDQLSIKAGGGSPGRKAVLAAIGDGEASVDQILVRVWRSTNRVMTRNTVMGHLFRLLKDDEIEKSSRHVYKRALTSA